MNPNQNRNAPNAPMDLVRKLLALPPSADLLMASATAGYALVDVSMNGRSFFTLLLIMLSLIFACLGIVAVIAKMRESGYLEDVAEKDFAELNIAQARRIFLACARAEGYSLVSEAQGAPFDAVFSRKKEMLLVRWSDWDDKRINLDTIKHLYKALGHFKNCSGMMVSRAKMDQDTASWAIKNGIEICNAEHLKRKVYAVLGEPLDQAAGTPPDQTQDVQEPETSTSSLPSSVLFLDFRLLDGKPTDTFERLLSSLPDSVIVSSTLHDTPLEELRSMLPASAHRLIGKTPKLEHFGQTARYYEIVEFLRGAFEGERVKWCAIDSEPKTFPAGCSELVPANINHGLDEVVCLRIAALHGLSIAQVINPKHSQAEPPYLGQTATELTMD